MRWKLHALMVEEMAKELTTILNTATEEERKRFVACLMDAMQLWAYELERARRLREALKEFVDEEYRYWYEEDEGDSDTFYNYYHSG
jgi:hypothetical protein